MMRIEYWVGVQIKAGGWRQVAVEADAEQISPAMLRVVAVHAIDGETPHYGQSRTGAHRQQFNGRYFADREVGTKKRLSAVRVLSETK